MLSDLENELPVAREEMGNLPVERLSMRHVGVLEIRPGATADLQSLTPR